MNRAPQGRGSMMRELAVGISVLTVLGAMFVTAFFQRLNDVTAPTHEAMQSIQHAVESSTHQGDKDEQKREVASEQPQESTEKLASPDEPIARIAERPTIAQPSTKSPTDATSFVPNPNTLDTVDPKVVPTPEPANDFAPVENEVEPSRPTPVDNDSFDFNSSIQDDSATPIVSARDETTYAAPVKFEMTTTERTFTVRPNDSFWSIAQQVYGDGSHFRALYVHNRERFPDPDDLRVGALVDTPPLETLKKVDTTIERTYVVRDGDSLFDIARRVLGQGSRYVEIIEANPELPRESSSKLPAGQTLRLPN